MEKKLNQRLGQELSELAAFCASRGSRAWLVGGAARDLARGKMPADLDLAVEDDGLALARAYADARGAAFVALDAERSTGRVVLASDPNPLTVDFASLRASTIEGDLRLRDFTVNALAIPLDAQHSALNTSLAFLDPTGGFNDLRAGTLRSCDPNNLRDDPLRTLRAARLCATLGLQPAPELEAQIRAAAPGIAGVAAERIRDELLKLLDAPAAAPWLRYLDRCSLLTRIVPELEPARGCPQPRVHCLPVLDHMLETVAALDWLIDGPSRLGGVAELPLAVQAVPSLTRELPYGEQLAALVAQPLGGGYRRAAILKLAALLHDNAKPQTREEHADGTVSFYGHQELGARAAEQIARRLRLGRHDVAYVTLVVAEHMRPGQLRSGDVLTARAVARFFRELGDAGPDVLLHELADHLATSGPRTDERGWLAHLAWTGGMLAAYYEPAPARRQPLVDGHALMRELGVQPGPQLGTLLREVAEAQSAGEIATREEAVALARKLFEQGGS